MKESFKKEKIFRDLSHESNLIIHSLEWMIEFKFACIISTKCLFVCLLYVSNLFYHVMNKPVSKQEVKTIHPRHL